MFHREIIRGQKCNVSIAMILYPFFLAQLDSIDIPRCPWEEQVVYF